MIAEAELKSNHEICLELLDKFLEVCDKYDIEYRMAFGSCLGAVRHKGFIPWDINIDVLLTVPEFRKLDEAFRSEDLGDLEWGMPDGSARMYPLLRKKGTWEVHHTNPNLDVSVYGGAPKGKLHKKFVIRMAYFNRKMFKLKTTKVKRRFPYNILKGIASVFPLSFYMKRVRKLERVGTRKNTDGYFVITPSVWKDRESIEQDWVGTEPVYAEFEGRKVRILKNYDAYLTRRYGNWKTPKVWEDKGEFHHAKK